MSISYTPSQRAAVTYASGNLLLSAAAGSGKTAALTGRIAQLLTESDTRLSEMLVVTYTRAAAAEMRERIGKRLAEVAEEARAGEDPEKLSRAVRAISDLPAARISTIHSFLYQAMRPYFPALGLSPETGVLEERTADSLREETMKDTADDFFAADPKDRDPDKEAPFPELADVVGQARDADSVDAELLWLDKRIASAGLEPDSLLRFADLLDRMAGREEDPPLDPLSTPLGLEVRRRVKLFSEHYRAAIRGTTDGFGEKEAERYLQDAEELLLFLDRTADAASSSGYADLKDRICSAAFQRLPTVRAKDLTDAGEAYRQFRGGMKEDLGALKTDFFSFGEEEIRETAARTARILRCAARVLAAFRDKLGARKRSMAALDYGDLEFYASKLLLNPDGTRTRAAREIGEGIKYLFIDEYQDTNGIQDRIFCALSPEAHRFMVGDIKQSIYRFRGADPSVFSDYRRRWPAVQPEEAESGDLSVLMGEEGRSLFMSENFRCSEAVVDFANAVSAHLLPHGGIPFEKEDLLIHAREEPTPPEDEKAEALPGVEIALIENPRKLKDADEPEDAGEAGSGGPEEDPEVAFAADEIAGMLGRYLGGKILSPGDVAVLLRSNRSAGAYRDALERRGIPAATKTARPLGSYPSVMLLTCLLNFVDNPLRDVYAAGALRSPVFSCTLADLIAVREAAGDLPLYTGIEKLADESDEESLDPGAPDEHPAPDSSLLTPHSSLLPSPSSLRASCRQIRDWLKRHKTVSRGMAADRYTEFLIRDTDFYALDGIRENGAERDAIHRFCAAVRGAESAGASSGGGLSGLLALLPDLLEASDPGDEGAGKQGDAVSVMSIHASKGLEFPVVFLCETAKARNTEDERRTVLFDGSLGFGMTLPDPGGLARCDTFARQAIAAKTARESVAEEMRMLYVAMTRARERLIVTGKASKPEDLLAEAEIEARCPDEYRALAAGSYLSWILEAAARAKNGDLGVPLPGSGFRIRVVPAEKEGEPEEPDAPAAVPGADPEPGEKDPGEPGPAETDASEFLRRFAFRYEDPLGRIPAKLTVSRLNPEILDGEGGGVTLSLDGEEPENAGIPVPAAGSKPAPKRPAFMTGDGEDITPAERGSATHVFLQFVDYKRLAEHGVRAETERLIREKYVSERTAGLFWRVQLERFRDSALLGKLLRSPMVKREFRFNALLPAERFTSDPGFASILASRGAKITVQGVVDCVFRDPDGGGLVLVDYKTDALTAEERRHPEKAAKKLLARHRNQLSYYKEICSAMFGEEIERTVIYSTVLGEEIEV